MFCFLSFSLPPNTPNCSLSVPVSPTVYCWSPHSFNCTSETSGVWREQMKLKVLSLFKETLLPSALQEMLLNDWAFVILWLCVLSGLGRDEKIPKDSFPPFWARLIFLVWTIIPNTHNCIRGYCAHNFMENKSFWQDKTQQAKTLVYNLITFRNLPYLKGQEKYACQILQTWILS